MLAVADPALAAHVDLKDRLASCLILDDLNVAELKPKRLVGAQPRVRHEEDEVVQLLARPFPSRLLGGFSARRRVAS